MVDYLRVTVEVIKKTEILLMETTKDCCLKVMQNKLKISGTSSSSNACFCYLQSTASAVFIRLHPGFQMWIACREVWWVLPWECLPCWSWVHHPLWHEMCKVPLLPCRKLQTHTHARTRSHTGKLGPLLMPLQGRGVGARKKWYEFKKIKS